MYLSVVVVAKQVVLFHRTRNHNDHAKQKLRNLKSHNHVLNEFNIFGSTVEDFLRPENIFFIYNIRFANLEFCSRDACTAIPSYLRLCVAVGEII